MIQQYSDVLATGIGVSCRGGSVISGNSGIISSATVGGSNLLNVDNSHNSSSYCDRDVQSDHLIVLQHGFLGNHYDMQHLENALFALLPAATTHVLSARCNDSANDESIHVMARNLVKELCEYVELNLPHLLDERTPGRFSFIGHSMGGLIIRKALEHDDLKFLRRRCHVYVSLATPHLGTVYAESPLVSAGMWTLLQWRQSAALKELNLHDTVFGDAKKTTLFRLSENAVLSWFKKVVLVSSPRDLYVPRYSASLRLHHCSKLSDLSNHHNQIIAKMHANMMGQLDAGRLIRLTIDNNVGTETNLNSVIGRAAHICYLESGVVSLQLVYTLYSYLYQQQL